MLHERVTTVLHDHRVRIGNAYEEDGRGYFWVCLCSAETRVDGFESGYDARNASDYHIAAVVVAAIEASQPNHIIEISDDGWTIQHSMQCRLEGNLFDCEVNRAAPRPWEASRNGRYECEARNGHLIIGRAVGTDA